MKKNKISLMAISALLTLIVVFATSCEKEEFTEPKEKKLAVENISQEDVLSKIKVENGILCFENFDHFTESIQFLNEMNDKEYLLWIQKKGVNTLYEKLVESIYSEMNEADNLKKGQTTQITEQNINDGYIYSVTDKEGAKILQPTCGIEPLSVVLNLNKLVIIGDEIRYYDNKCMKIISNKNFDLIQKAITLNESNKDITVINYTNKGDRLNWGEGWKNADNGKYRIQYQVSFRQIKTSSTKYETWYWTSQYSYKKNIWGNYKYHKTTFSIHHNYWLRWTPLNGSTITRSYGMAGGRTAQTYYCMFVHRTDYWANFTHTHEIIHGDMTMNTDHVNFSYSHDATGSLK